jgi:hypothetical protein
MKMGYDRLLTDTATTYLGCHRYGVSLTFGRVIAHKYHSSHTGTTSPVDGVNQ